MRTARTTRGATLLAAALASRGISQRSFEKMLGTSKGLVSRWLSGERVPCLAAAFEIERAVDVPAQSWTEPAWVAEARRLTTPPERR